MKRVVSLFSLSFLNFMLNILVSLSGGTILRVFGTLKKGNDHDDD
jgi:hypothetical protein